MIEITEVDVTQSDTATHRERFRCTTPGHCYAGYGRTRDEAIHDMVAAIQENVFEVVTVRLPRVKTKRKNGRWKPSARCQELISHLEALLPHTDVDQLVCESLLAHKETVCST